MKLNIFKREITFILLGVIFLGSGCKKFLEEKNPSNLTPATYYTIPEHAESAIASVYSDTRFIGRGAAIFSFNWQMLDAPTGTSLTESGENTNLTSLYSLSYDATNLHNENWWKGLYKIIANANLVINKVPNINPMDAAQKARIIGEARFLRAWAYFYAVRLWGDIPLITQPQTASSENFLPTRTPQKDVYKLIVDDLVAADVSGLPWMDVTGRVSLAAVKAELARVYLTMAGQPLNKGAEYYKLAADKAKEIITYSNANPLKINLFNNYDDLHNVNQENQVEQLFEIQFKDGIESNSSLVCLLPNFKPVTVYGTYGIGTTVPTKSFYNSFEQGDLRAKNREGFFYSDYYTKGSGPLFSLGAQYIYKYFDVVSYGTSGKTGIGKENLNLMNIRYAEILLLFAEAQNEVNGGPNQDAYDALKRIRDRAQLSTLAIGTYNKTSFQQDVWRERWHELCYEGVTLFDMTRLKKVYNETTNNFDDFIGHINVNSNQALQAKHLLFPLPRFEMLNNPKLTPQNPGY